MTANVWTVLAVQHESDATTRAQYGVGIVRDPVRHGTPTEPGPSPDDVDAVVKAVAGAVTSLSSILKPVADEAAATMGRKITNNDDKTLVVHSGNVEPGDEGGRRSISYAGYEFEFVAVELDRESKGIEGSDTK